MYEKGTIIVPLTKKEQNRTKLFHEWNYLKLFGTILIRLRNYFVSNELEKNCSSRFGTILLRVHKT